MNRGIGTNRNILVFYSSTNAKGKHDATGAFIPEAKAFKKLHNIPDENFIGVKCVGVPTVRRRRIVLDTIHDRGSEQLLDAVAFFGHGWPRGIQFGFNRDHVDELAALLERKASNDVRIVLYACLAAENDKRDSKVEGVGPATNGGFADELRDAMVLAGISEGLVDAHKTAGHTTWNPYVVRFLCKNVDAPDYGGVGGAWLVAPRSEHWRDWIRALRNKSGGLRYRFPFMSQFEILAELVLAAN